MRVRSSLTKQFKIPVMAESRKPETRHQAPARAPHTQSRMLWPGRRESARRSRITSAGLDSVAAPPVFALVFLLLSTNGCSPAGRSSNPALPEATASPLPPVRIIPQPKLFRPGRGVFTIRPGAACSVRGARGEGRPAAAIARLLGASVHQLASRDGWATIRVGKLRTEPARGGKWAKDAEGYRLEVTPAGIEIHAPTARGAFYAVQTLSQVLRRRGKAWECPALRIEDWPSMRFRGAHFFPSASGAKFHRRLVDTVLSRFKLNHAVIQCEAARWDSHPEIAAPNSVSKADLETLVAVCRNRFLEPVPLVNGPGHAEWLFRNGTNLGLAEDRATPYAYCVRRPEAQRFIREIAGEALDVFGSRLFHMGHDEVTLKGQFPHPDCPRCARSSTTELVLENARGLSTWLSRRGVRSMLWGDMLFAREERVSSAHAPSPEEAQARRRGLPREFTVADWHYNSRGEFPSLAILKRERLRSVACTWYEPENIYRFSQEALKVGADGLLQTTWAGYFPDERVLSGKELRQFTAFILAAEYAWSGRSDPPSRLGYRPADVFRTAYGL
jgi:hexosaminidase